MLCLFRCDSIETHLFTLAASYHLCQCLIQDRFAISIHRTHAYVATMPEQRDIPKKIPWSEKSKFSLSFALNSISFLFDVSNVAYELNWTVFPNGFIYRKSFVTKNVVDIRRKKYIQTYRIKSFFTLLFKIITTDIIIQLRFPFSNGIGYLSTGINGIVPIPKYIYDSFGLSCGFVRNLFLSSFSPFW